MFRLTQALRSYREAGSLNEQINLFGFVDNHTFLTKSGDAGVVLAVKGVDYECLASREIDNYTKRLESAFKILDDKCRYLPVPLQRQRSRHPVPEPREPDCK